MVWGAFSASGKADLVVMEGKKNSARYINVLEKSLSFMNRLDTSNAIFQQDNALIYTSKLTKKKTGLKRKILKFWTGPLSLQI